MLSVNALNTLNKPIQAGLLTFFQMFILFIPLAFIGSHFYGILGIFCAITIATVLTGILSHFWLNFIIKKINIIPAQS